MGRRVKRTKSIISRLMVIGVVAASIAALPQLQQSAPGANASGVTDKVGLYLSAPMVQGTGVTQSVVRENFDAFTPGSCPTTISAVSSMVFRNSGSVVTNTSSPSVCDLTDWVSNTNIYSGASTDSATPTYGGSGTHAMAVPYYSPSSLANERSITFELNTNAKYVGFWWSGGNAGNIVRFFDAQDNLVAEIDSADISTLLSGAGTVPDLANNTYNKSRYYGNPVYYTSLTAQPTSGISTNANAVIFTYLNLFVQGSIEVAKVQFAGPGFEFDNLALSTVEQSPETSMVKVLEKESSQLVWNPETRLTATQSPATPSVLPTRTGTGAVSYAVKSAGTTGCTVNSSTGVISYSAAGDCSVTATVAGTSTHLKNTITVPFTVGDGRVTFQPNQAPGSSVSQTATTTTALRSNTFTRSGYDFAGWNTLANGTGTAYTDGQSYSFAISTTLYAQWTTAQTQQGSGSGSGSSSSSSEPVRQPVLTLMPNGAGVSQLTFAANGNAHLSAKNFERKGYLLNSWNTLPNGKGVTYRSLASVPTDRDTVIYAQWVPAKSKKLIPGFAPNKPLLTQPMKLAISKWAKALPTDAKIVCQGSTLGSVVNKFQKELAANRATNTCNYARKVRTDLKFSVDLNPASGLAASARHVWMTFDSTK
ncbi:MAG: hypothetical protein RLZ41_980 [Actinomycetota bacterium]